MDVVEDGHSGKVLIQFANRIDDEGMLKDALRRMECQNKEVNADGYVVLEIVLSTDASAVAERVNYWIEKNKWLKILHSFLLSISYLMCNAFFDAILRCQM